MRDLLSSFGGTVTKVCSCLEKLNVQMCFFFAFGVISFGGQLYESESFLIAFNGKLTRLCKTFMLI